MNISRRDALLGASAAAVVTGAIAAPLAIKAAGVKAALAGDTVTDLNDKLLLALERELWAFRDNVFAAHPDESDEAMDVLYDRWQEMEEVIYCNAAQTPTGVLVKLRVWVDRRTSIADERPYRTPWWRDALDPMPVDEWGLALIIRDLERLSGALPS